MTVLLKSPAGPAVTARVEKHLSQERENHRNTAARGD
jgi:hypothetical protein